MRLNLRLTGNTKPVPFDHLPQLVGTFHKWAGPNNLLHDGPSLYSMGWLQGGEVHNDDLHFPRGASWSLSFFDEEAGEKVREGIAEDRSVAYGMSVYKTTEVPTPDFGGLYRFEVGSPVLARETVKSGRRRHFAHDDPKADAVLTRTLKTKLKISGFEGAHLDVMVGFDRSYTKAHTKVVRFKQIGLKANICPVIVAGTPEAVRFAYDVGVGELTGCGMGFLKSVT